MQTFAGVTYNEDIASVGQSCGDVRFESCRFDACYVLIPDSPELRVRIHDVWVSDCIANRCSINGAELSDLRICNCETLGLVDFRACAFRHVWIGGSVGSIMFHPVLNVLSDDETRQRRFVEANAKFHAAVDWALDIRNAEFTAVPDIRDIPASLIIREPETQVVVSRESALARTWTDLDLPAVWKATIQGMLEDGFQDVVLVAPKRHRKFAKLLQGLVRLREAGVALED